MEGQLRLTREDAVRRAQRGEADALQRVLERLAVELAPFAAVLCGGAGVAVSGPISHPFAAGRFERGPLARAAQLEASETGDWRPFFDAIPDRCR